MTTNTLPLFQLHETRDYSEFSYYKFNRPIDKKKVNRLAKSISQETSQLISPIVCDPEGRIIDGQHRLEALKGLGLPVHYVIRRLDGDIIKYLINANNVLDKWKHIDFARLWAETGNQNYIDLLGVYDKWEKKLNRTIPFGRIVHSYTGDEGSSFKQGNATFYKKQGDKIWNILFELDKLYEDKMAFHFNNIRSLKKLLRKNRIFNSEHFIEQCQKKKFNTFSTVEDTVDSMVAVYNYHILQPSKKIKA